MSLITEINRTETEKNKTKIVATNIDNKLVELGGEQAINLADVPNKIEKMIEENYVQIARSNNYITKSYRAGEPGAPPKGTKTYSFEFDIKEDFLLNFDPKTIKAVVYVTFWESKYSTGGGYASGYLESKKKVELIGDYAKYYIRSGAVNDYYGYAEVIRRGDKIEFKITHEFPNGRPVEGFSSFAEIRIGPYVASTRPGVIIE